MISACLLAAAPLLSPPPEPPAPLQRVLCLGASITEGFGLARELGGTATIADFVAGAIAEPGEVEARGTTAFFSDPDKFGKRQVERIGREEPTLVVAVEFLFWFAYGAGLTEPERLALFERGLALLAPVEVPVVVGDVPDMSAALRGRSELTGGPFLTPDMIPAPETRAAMNARLAAFAAEHERVLVLPLERLLADLHAGRPITLGALVLSEEGAAELLQADLLHTTPRGTALLARAALEVACAGLRDVPPEALVDDADRIVERARARVVERAAARQRRLDRARQRPAEGGGDGASTAGGRRAPAAAGRS